MEHASMSRAELLKELKELREQIEILKASDTQDELKSLHAQYRHLPYATYTFKKTQEGFILVDWNKLAEKISSRDISDLRNVNLKKVLPGRTDIFKDMEECIDGGKTIEKEMKFIFRGEKAERDISSIYVPVPPDTVLVQVKDISGQKKTEQALKDSESRFEQVIRSVEDVICIVDENLNYIFISPSMECQRGYSVEEAMSMSAGDMFTTESYQELMKALQKSLLKMKTISVEEAFPTKRMELEVKRKDGSTYWAEFHATPLVGSDGHFRGFVSVSRDITDRKKAHKLLEYEKNRLEMITMNAGAGIMIISRDYRIIWANKMVIDMFGEVEGAKCHSSLYQRNDICPDCCIGGLFDKGLERTICRQTGRDIRGAVVHSNIIATPLKDEKGTVESALVVIIPVRNEKASNGRKSLEMTIEKKLREFESIKSEIIDFMMKTVAEKKSSEDMSARWLSLEEITAYLGIKRDTVYKWIKRKKLPAQKIGGLWKFRLSEIDAWLESQRENEE